MFYWLGVFGVSHWEPVDHLQESLGPSGPETPKNVWDPAGLVWHGKRPKAGNGKKMEIEMENGPKLDRGKNGQKMAQKRKINGKLPQKSIFGAIFWPFLPLSSLGPFSISISIFLFPFPAFGRFPRHTSPAGSKKKKDVPRGRREAPLTLTLRLQRSYFLDPILFSHFPASAKIRSDQKKIRSDLKNKIAGASGKARKSLPVFWPLFPPCTPGPFSL